MSKRVFICAANWKMNKTPDEAQEFMKLLTSGWPEDLTEEAEASEKSAVEIFIYPPSILWREVREGIRDLPLKWGLQNGHPEPSGAFTGETSMSMIADLGAHTVLVGHSERRALFGEADEWLAAKVAAAQDCQLAPMLCLGETLEQRDSGSTEQVISQQLELGLAKADFSKKLYLAYEPVWAIGTGKVASAEMAQSAHQILRAKLARLAGAEVAETTSILYGGSVKPDNAAELSRQPDVDGFLVGGASLKSESFLQIIQASI